MARVNLDALSMYDLEAWHLSAARVIGHTRPTETMVEALLRNALCEVHQLRADRESEAYQ